MLKNPCFRAVLAWFLIKKWLVWQMTEIDVHNANFFSLLYICEKKLKKVPSVPVNSREGFFQGEVFWIFLKTRIFMHQNWILDFKSITFSHFYFSIFLSNTNTKGFSRWLNFIFLLRFDPHVGIWPPSFRVISRKCSKTLVLGLF